MPKPKEAENKIVIARIHHQEVRKPEYSRKTKNAENIKGLIIKCFKNNYTVPQTIQIIMEQQGKVVTADYVYHVVYNYKKGLLGEKPVSKGEHTREQILYYLKANIEPVKIAEMINITKQYVYRVKSDSQIIGYLTGKVAPEKVARLLNKPLSEVEAVYKKYEHYILTNC